jgi:hypothetical protein
MSEEKEESTGSSLKKTILGTIATVVTAGGAWLGSTLFGGGEDKAAAPAPAPVINITNSNQQSQAAGGKTVIINQKAADPKPAVPAKPKKEGDEFKEKPAQW